VEKEQRTQLRLSELKITAAKVGRHPVVFREWTIDTQPQTLSCPGSARQRTDEFTFDQGVILQAEISPSDSPSIG